METDYNLHKSNSTYFADLDVARTHLLSCLLRRGMHRARFGPPDQSLPAAGTPAVAGAFSIHLGGVACNFRAAIAPFQRYEIWTRVLAWDEKWLYVVSHIVRHGAVRPASYTLQPRKNRARPSAVAPTSAEIPSGPAGQPKSDRIHSAILATSIAKYVFKKGRRTIPPETALHRSDLLPSRPNIPEPSASSATSAMEVSGDGLPSCATNEAEDLGMGATVDLPWVWDRIEAERRRGLSLAANLSALDGLNHEFTEERTPALAEY